MTQINDIRTGRHCVFVMHVHLVFVAKYRKTVFDKDAIERLRELFEKICAGFDAELKEMDGEGDHVHLLVNFPPKVSVSKLVNSLKGVSSRRLKQLHPELIKPAYMKNSLWSPSYYAGNVGGAPISVIRQYIEQQSRPH